MSDSILFINASQHAKGNTYALGQKFLQGKEFTEINLVNYKVYPLGQNYPDDQFRAIFEQIKTADKLVLGSAVYWHSMTGYMHILLERISQMPREELEKMGGKKVYLLIQGENPSDTIEPATRLINRFCRILHWNFIGEATYDDEIESLREKI